MSVIPSPFPLKTRPAPQTLITPNLQSPQRRFSWFRLRNQRQGVRAEDAPPRTKIAYTLARPRRMKRCARRVLLWSLAFYALAALALHLLMYRWCPDLAARAHRAKWPRLRQVAAEAADRPLVVTLGSSRMDAAFQARQLDGWPGPDGRPLVAYNFAIPSAGPLHEYQYVCDMLDAGIRPSLLVIEVLPPLFNTPYRHLFSEEDWGVADWMSMHQFRRMHRYFARPGHKLGQWIEGRLAPVFVYRGALQACAEWLMKPPEERQTVSYEHDGWGCRPLLSGSVQIASHCHSDK